MLRPSLRHPRPRFLELRKIIWRLQTFAAPLALALSAILILVSAAPARGERLKDIARWQGVRSNALTGYGLVVGLSGTGDQNLQFTIQSLKSATARLGVMLPPGVNPQLKNAAAVIITTELPAFARPGQRLDVTVSALGQARSLRGGTLLMAPMQGADGEVYALAQGNLAVGGFGAEGRDGSRIVVGTPSSGRIPGGAAVERAVPSPFTSADSLVLVLTDPDFTTAQTAADAINALFGGAEEGASPPLAVGPLAIAQAEDAATIRIRAPADTSARIAMAAAIESLDIAPASPAARVIINARTGTVVIGGQVRILPAAVAHGNLTVRITENQQASQPGPLGRGQTVVTQQSTVEAEEPQVRMALFAPGVQLSAIVDAVNALGAAPGDLVAILEALKAAGALRAELIVI